MQRVDQRVLRFGEIDVVVALNRLIEKREPDQQHQPQARAAADWLRYAGFHRTTGLRAAVTSSTRLVRVVCGAFFTSLRIGLDFLGDRDHRVDEQIEFALAFGLGRLDHQRAVHDQREADRVRMEAVIDQALGDVAGAHAVCACRSSLNTHFVHVGRVDRADRNRAPAACGCSWRSAPRPPWRCASPWPPCARM